VWQGDHACFATRIQESVPDMPDMPAEFMDMIKNLEENMKAQGVDPDKLAEDPEGLAKMMEHMMGGAPEMQGMMQNVMQQMMSKDLLFEPMKQLKDLYPPWFAEHGSDHSPAQLKSYKQQYKIVQKLVHHFENEPDDPEKVGELMQQMQDLGHPPEAIIKQLSPDMELGPDGQPLMPKGPNGEQCCIQ
jgi:peroxin-19